MHKLFIRSLPHTAGVGSQTLLLDTRPVADSTSAIWPLPSRLLHPYQVVASSHGMWPHRVAADPSCSRERRLKSRSVPDSTSGLWPLRQGGVWQQTHLACARASSRLVAVCSELACGRMC